MHAEVAAITLLALILYFYMSLQVGQARRKYGVPAPETVGDPAFMRINRIHINTLEGLALFLPALWIFAVFSGHDRIAAGFGLLWIVGRILYMTGYAKAAEQRSAGFGVQALATMALIIGGLVSVGIQLAHGGL